MFLRKLRYLRLSIFLIYRPEPDQFILVNSAVRPFAKLQFALDFARKYFQMPLRNDSGGAILLSARHFCQC